MNEYWAAIIVSVVTGTFGFLGVVVTQLAASLAARNKARAPQTTVDKAIEDYSSPSIVAYLGAQRTDIRELKLDVREGFMDVIARLEVIQANTGPRGPGQVKGEN